MFSCEICQSFKYIYFEEHLRTTASEEPVVEQTSRQVEWVE